MPFPQTRPKVCCNLEYFAALNSFNSIIETVNKVNKTEQTE